MKSAIACNWFNAALVGNGTVPGLKLAVAAGVLGGLAACTTAPQLPAASLVAARLTQTPQTEPPPKSHGIAAIPADPVPSQPSSNASPPAVLAGESALEFERGAASWYGPGFHGRRTASGERYDMNAFTAAHRTLPFGTWVRVHSLVNGREVDVRITDRGPFARGRIIDVSRAAAMQLDMLGLGFKQVALLTPSPVATPNESALLPASAVRPARAPRKP